MKILILSIITLSLNAFASKKSIEEQIQFSLDAETQFQKNKSSKDYRIAIENQCNITYQDFLTIIKKSQELKTENEQKDESIFIAQHIQMVEIREILLQKLLTKALFNELEKLKNEFENGSPHKRETISSEYDKKRNQLLTDILQKIVLDKELQKNYKIVVKVPLNRTSNQAGFKPNPSACLENTSTEKNSRNPRSICFFEEPFFGSFVTVRYHEFSPHTNNQIHSTITLTKDLSSNYLSPSTQTEYSKSKTYNSNIPMMNFSSNKEPITPSISYEKIFFSKKIDKKMKTEQCKTLKDENGNEKGFQCFTFNQKDMEFFMTSPINESFKLYVNKIDKKECENFPELLEIATSFSNKLGSETNTRNSSPKISEQKSSPDKKAIKHKAIQGN
tara:strand:- start:65 stop:1234 length:1170 start_codon:yes stop_codon:yes gene_type:complete